MNGEQSNDRSINAFQPQQLVHGTPRGTFSRNIHNLSCSNTFYTTQFFWRPMHFSARCAFCLTSLTVRPTASVCPRQVGALRERYMIGLWLLWGTYMKSPPPGYSETHLQLHTTTLSLQIGAHNPQPGIGLVVGFPCVLVLMVNAKMNEDEYR